MPQALPQGTTFGQTGELPFPGQNPAPLYGWRTPDWGGQLARQHENFNEDLTNKKFGMLQSLFGQAMGMFGGGQGHGSFGGMMPPRPSYINAGPVWSQGQIDAQSNLQRGNLLGQAATQTNAFSNQLGARGFSPMGPLAGIMGQQNLMRANAGAAQNDTNLNFQAAKANSDARLQGAGINAGMYGDYVKSLPAYGQLNLDAQLRPQQMTMQLLQSLLGSLG